MIISNILMCVCVMQYSGYSIIINIQCVCVLLNDTMCLLFCAMCNGYSIQYNINVCVIQ